MNFKALQNLITNTTAYTAVGAAQIALPASVIAMLTAQLAGGYYTAVAVTDGVSYEVMNILGVTAGAADVERGQDGTTAVPLAKGSQVRFVWTTEGIENISTAGGPVTLTGSGASVVTGGPNYNVDSPFWTFTGVGLVNVYAGATPYDIIIEQNSIMAQVTIAGTGLAVVTGGPLNYNVDVSEPNFVGAGGITITGTWPNITITNALASGGTLVGVTGGAGIAVTGSLTLNPTISLSTVGPGPGTYGGIQLNAYGQVVAFTGSMITSLTTSTSGVTIGAPSPGALTINVADASSSQKGLVTFAPNTAAGSNDTANNDQAVTPSGIAAVVSTLTTTLTPASFTIVGNQNALSPAAYTNTISSFIINIPIIAAGRSALIDLYVESYDPVNPTVQQNLGIGLFDAAILLAGVSNLVSGNVRHLKYLINGPTTVVGSLTVKTTPLAGTQIIGSYHASVTKNF